MTILNLKLSSRTSANMQHFCKIRLTTSRDYLIKWSKGIGEALCFRTTSQPISSRTAWVKMFISSTSTGASFSKAKSSSSTHSRNTSRRTAQAVTLSSTSKRKFLSSSLNTTISSRSRSKRISSRTSRKISSRRSSMLSTRSQSSRWLMTSCSEPTSTPSSIPHSPFARNTSFNSRNRSIFSKRRSSGSNSRARKTGTNPSRA